MFEKVEMRAHIQKIAVDNGFDTFITISCPHRVEFSNVTKRYHRKAMTWKDIPDLHRLVGTYGNALSIKVYGKHPKGKKRPIDKTVPFMTFLECRTRFGEDTHPHYHILSKFLKDKEEELIEFSHQFWKIKGLNSFGVSIVPDIKGVYDLIGVSNYVSKRIEDNLSIEKIIDRGVRLGR